MHKNQRVSDMANEVLARQAQATQNIPEKHSKMPLRAFSRPRQVGTLGSFAMGPTVARGRPSGRRTSYGGVGESVSRPLGSSLGLPRLSSESWNCKRKSNSSDESDDRKRRVNGPDYESIDAH
jgi:hypothetical protein